MHGVRLILNDGTVIENGRAGYSEGHLWCYMTGYTIQQVAEMFLDRIKTSKIFFQYGEMQDEYDRFTNCVNISVNVDGEAAVCLIRENENA